MSLDKRLQALEQQTGTGSTIEQQIQDILCDEIGLEMTDDEMRWLVQEHERRGYTRLTWVSYFSIISPDIRNTDDDFE